MAETEMKKREGKKKKKIMVWGWIMESLRKAESQGVVDREG